MKKPSPISGSRRGAWASWAVRSWKGEDCMNAKVLCSCALVLTVLSACPARAEELPAPTRYGGDPAPAPVPEEPPAHVPAPQGLSSWITYTRPDCCGPVGGQGPIKWELYGRTGP